MSKIVQSIREALPEATKTGFATLVTGALLKLLYMGTREPPPPVFWFFIGFTAQLGIGVYKHNMPAPVATGLGGFGESIASIDSKIGVYQANISGLQKILRVGSAQGKAAARKKLAVAQSNLARLFRMRDQAEDS